MKILIFLSILLASSLSWARFYSPYPSTVKKVCLPNTHSLEENGYLYRGMEPYDLEAAKELKKLGIQQILIFKPDKHGAVTENIKRLKSIGYQDKDIVHIPFPYKNMNEFTRYCKMVVQGLQVLKKAKEDKVKTFLHCTVGEDRTGLLSGLYKHLVSEDKNHKRIFYKEMCHKGFGHGNPQKPMYRVVYPIRESLTPLYLKMAYLINIGRLTIDNLDPNVCSTDPQQEPFFSQNRDYKPWRFKCKPRKVEPWVCKAKNYPLSD